MDKPVIGLTPRKLWNFNQMMRFWKWAVNKDKLPPIKNLIDAQLGRTVHPYIDFTKLNSIILGKDKRWGAPAWHENRVISHIVLHKTITDKIADMWNKSLKPLHLGIDPASPLGDISVFTVTSGIGKSDFHIKEMVRLAKAGETAAAVFRREMKRFSFYYDPLNLITQPIGNVKFPEAHRLQLEDLVKNFPKLRKQTPEERAFEKMMLFPYRYNTPGSIMNVKPISWEEGKRLEAEWLKAYDKLPSFLKGCTALVTNAQVQAMNALPFNKFPKLKSKDDENI